MDEGWEEKKGSGPVGIGICGGGGGGGGFCKWKEVGGGFSGWL